MTTFNQEGQTVYGTQVNAGGTVRQSGGGKRPWAVWSQPFTMADTPQTYPMPMGARILSAHRRGGQAVMWYLCQPHRVAVERTFQVVGTGIEFDWNSDWEFVATVMTGSNPFDSPSTEVYHLWELPS